MLLALASCERNEGVHPGIPAQEAETRGLITTEKKPAKNDPAGKEPEKPAKDDPPPVLIEKNAPVAEPAPGQPGKVISPFNGQLIDVSGMAPGSLVADPTYPPEAKKHFRVPEEPAPKPPSILDPAILIRPKTPPKEESVEPEER